MSDTSNLERYLSGEPLNEELAALQRGDMANPARPEIAAIIESLGPRMAQPDDEKPLSYAERIAIKEAYQAGVFTSLMRLMRKSLRTKQNVATIDSENDPLGRPTEVAQAWAYIAIYRRVMVELTVMIEGEIAKFDGGQTQ